MVTIEMFKQCKIC